MPPRRRARPRQANGSTSQRGYGSEHQTRRKALLNAHIEGTPCRKCGQPMYKAQGLDAGHGDPRALNANSIADALEHSYCNRAEGPQIAAQLRRSGEQQAELSAAVLQQQRAERQRYCARRW